MFGMIYTCSYFGQLMWSFDHEVKMPLETIYRYGHIITRFNNHWLQLNEQVMVTITSNHFTIRIRYGQMIITYDKMTIRYGQMGILHVIRPSDMAIGPFFLWTWDHQIY